MPNPIYVIDADGQQLLMNEAMEELIGLPRDQAAELELFELMRTDETHDTETTFLDVALADEEPINDREVQILTHDDEHRDVVVSVAPLYDGDDELMGGIAGFEDVTELRDKERALNETQERVAAELGDLAVQQEEKTEAAAETAETIRSSATEQAEKLEDVTEELHSFSAQMEEVAAKTDEISQAAEQATSAVAEGRDASEQAQSATESVVNQTTDLVETVDELASRMDDVEGGHRRHRGNRRSDEHPGTERFDRSGPGRRSPAKASRSWRTRSRTSQRRRGLTPRR